jgi:hypothetical protein
MNYGEWQPIYVTKDNRVAVVWSAQNLLTLSCYDNWTPEELEEVLYRKTYEKK